MPTDDYSWVFSYIIGPFAAVSLLRGCFWVWLFLRNRRVLSCAATKFDESKRQLTGSSLPFVTILIPALHEEKSITRFLSDLACLNYPQSRYRVVVITTERESLQRRGPDEMTTMGAVDLFLSKREYPHIRRVHYPEIYGNKSDQLNFALACLDREAALNGYIAVLDADSTISADTLLVFAWATLSQPSCRVFQQPHIWLKNLEAVSPTMQASAILHTFYTMSFEFWMIQRSQYAWYPPAYCMGNGMFIETSLLREMMGFPKLIDDSRFGFRCAFLGEPIGLIPLPTPVDAAIRVPDWIRQTSVWFTGPLFLWQDFRFARKLNPKSSLLRSACLFVCRNVQTLIWMNYGLGFVLCSLFLLFFKEYFLFAGFVFALSLAKVFVPSILVRIYVQRMSIRASLVTALLSLPHGMMVHCLSSTGPYLAIARMLKSARAVGVNLPKTPRAEK